MLGKYTSLIPELFYREVRIYHVRLIASWHDVSIDLVPTSSSNGQQFPTFLP